MGLSLSRLFVFMKGSAKNFARIENKLNTGLRQQPMQNGAESLDADQQFWVNR